MDKHKSSIWFWLGILLEVPHGILSDGGASQPAVRARDSCRRFVCVQQRPRLLWPDTGSEWTSISGVCVAVSVETRTVARPLPGFPVLTVSRRDSYITIMALFTWTSTGSSYQSYETLSGAWNPLSHCNAFWEAYQFQNGLRPAL